VFICTSSSEKLRHARDCLLDIKAGAFTCAALVTTDVTAFVMFACGSRIEISGKHVIGSLCSRVCIVMETVGSECRGLGKGRSAALSVIWIEECRWWMFVDGDVVSSRWARGRRPQRLTDYE
jgi:hypothetical protein